MNKVLCPGFRFELHALKYLLRSESSVDEEFLIRLYDSTRYDIDRATMLEELKQLLKRQQFDMQRAHYRKQFPDAEYLVICEDQNPIGRIYIATSATEVRLIDISLAPPSRGKGIGTFLITLLAQQADAEDLPLRLRVESDNKARSLYQRLGFKTLDDENTHVHMELQGLASNSDAAALLPAI